MTTPPKRTHIHGGPSVHLYIYRSVSIDTRIRRLVCVKRIHRYGDPSVGLYTQRRVSIATEIRRADPEIPITLNDTLTFYRCRQSCTAQLSKMQQPADTQQENWTLSTSEAYSLIPHPILPPSLKSLTVSVNVKHHERRHRTRELCEQGGGPTPSFSIPF